MYNLSGSFQDYLKETIIYQLESSEQEKYHENFRYVAHNKVTESQRENFFTCVANLCADLNLSTSTGLLACMYIDRFLSKKLSTQSKIFELLGITSLSIACKYKEGVSLSPEKIQNMLSGKYSIDAIVTTEQYMLSVLNWELAIVTSCDLVQSLLELTFGSSVPKRLLDSAMAFSALCYADFKVASTGTYNVAVSSILLSLKKSGYSDMMQEWLETLEESIPVDKEKVNIAIDSVLNKLESFSRD